MFDVVMTCPTTGRDSRVPFEPLTQEQWDHVEWEDNTVVCQACGGQHLVRTKDELHLRPPAGSDPFRRS